MVTAPVYSQTSCLIRYAKRWSLIILEITVIECNVVCLTFACCGSKLLVTSISGTDRAQRTSAGALRLLLSIPVKSVLLAFLL